MSKERTDEILRTVRRPDGTIDVGAAMMAPYKLLQHTEGMPGGRLWVAAVLLLLVVIVASAL